MQRMSSQAGNELNARGPQRCTESFCACVAVGKDWQAGQQRGFQEF